VLEINPNHNLNQAKKAVAGFTRRRLPFFIERRPIVETAIRQTLRAAESFPCIIRPTRHRSISVYRVSLVKDESVSFGNVRLANSQQAQALIQNLILTKGQPDREQFVVALLNAKNEMIGLNIVSVGALSSAPVHPREVLKPAILANAAAMILATTILPTISNPPPMTSTLPRKLSMPPPSSASRSTNT
jgi:hypothetical protein